MQINPNIITNKQLRLTENALGNFLKTGTEINYNFYQGFSKEFYLKSCLSLVKSYCEEKESMSFTENNLKIEAILKAHKKKRLIKNKTRIKKREVGLLDTKNFSLLYLNSNSPLVNLHQFLTRLLVNPFGYIISRRLNSDMSYDVSVRICSKKRICSRNHNFFDYVFVKNNDLQVIIKPIVYTVKEKNNFYIPPPSLFDDSNIIYSKDMLPLIEQKKNSSV